MEISIHKTNMKYEWHYIITGTDIPTFWYSDTPPPTKIGLYLVSLKGRSCIFHVTDISEGRLTAQTQYIRYVCIQEMLS